MQILPSGHRPPARPRPASSWRRFAASVTPRTGSAGSPRSPLHRTTSSPARTRTSCWPPTRTTWSGSSGPGTRRASRAARATTPRPTWSSGWPTAILVPDAEPALYVYEQFTARSGRPAGPAAARPDRRGASWSPREAGIVQPHEAVAPGPVAGRLALMEATQANLEPIFLLYDGAVRPQRRRPGRRHPDRDRGRPAAGRRWPRPGPRTASGTGCGRSPTRPSWRDRRRPGPADGADRRRAPPLRRLPGAAASAVRSPGTAPGRGTSAWPCWSTRPPTRPRVGRHPPGHPRPGRPARPPSWPRARSRCASCAGGTADIPAALDELGAAGRRRRRVRGGRGRSGLAADRPRSGSAGCGHGRPARRAVAAPAGGGAAGPADGPRLAGPRRRGHGPACDPRPGRRHRGPPTRPRTRTAVLASPMSAATCTRSPPRGG